MNNQNSKEKEIIIDGTNCVHAHFDGGNTQRLICSIDDCFCDCERPSYCYYKQLQIEKIAYKNLLEIHNEDNAESNKEQEEFLKELNKYREIINSACIHNLTIEAEKRVLIKTLQEIKDIVADVVDTEFNEDFVCYHLGNVLKKITEAIK